MHGPTAGEYLAPYAELFALDLGRWPGDPGFVSARHAMGGSSPAMLGRGVYSVGTGGLAAFGPPPPRADLTLDERVDLEDLYAWEQSRGDRDVDRSGAGDAADRSFLLAELRRAETRALGHRR